MEELDQLYTFYEFELLGLCKRFDPPMPATTVVSFTYSIAEILSTYALLTMTDILRYITDNAYNDCTGYSYSLYETILSCQFHDGLSPG